MNRRLFIVIIGLTLFLDQLTKISAVNFLNSPVKVLGDFIKLNLVYNYRGLFGLGFGPGIFYFLLPLIGILLVLYLTLKTKESSHLRSYALILGGALGNILDRIRLGKVVDFIDIGIKDLRWPTFNFADFFIVVGIILLFAKEIFKHKSRGREAK